MNGNATLNPQVLRWARNKAGLSEETLAKRVGVQLGLVKEWESSGSIPIGLVEKLAKITRIAFGFLFLNELPNQSLPIADFRRIDETLPTTPSNELLDVIYDAQRKQSWYREYLIANGHNPLQFVGRYSLRSPLNDTASDIRKTLGIGPELAKKTSRWEETIRYAIEATEEHGILVLRAGFAGGDTGRKLDVDEFRGFAMSDKYAPLIFINGADALAAQIFTIAHEIAHIWIGETGVSNLEKTYAPDGDVERYCNSVAAEVLLPLKEIQKAWTGGKNDTREVERLSYRYKISRIVVARRARDARLFDDDEFANYYRLIVSTSKKSKSAWSDFFQNEKYRNSKLFSITILQEALAGRVMQRDAMQFLGIKKESTLRKYARSLEGGVEWPIF